MGTFKLMRGGADISTVATMLAINITYTLVSMNQ